MLKSNFKKFDGKVMQRRIFTPRLGVFPKFHINLAVRAITSTILLGKSRMSVSTVTLKNMTR